MVQLTERLKNELDERAKREGISRSQLIRDVLNAYLEDDRLARQVENFKRAYADLPETDGELRAAAADARAMLLDEVW